MNLICEADDLCTLKELGAAHASSFRWVAYNSNKQDPVYTKTQKQAEKARIRQHGCPNFADKIYCDGSGGGVYNIQSEILFILHGSTAPFTSSERLAYRGIAQALIQATK